MFEKSKELLSSISTDEIVRSLVSLGAELEKQTIETDKLTDSTKALNKALEFIKGMSPEEWQEYESKIEPYTIDYNLYEDDSGFEIIDYSDYGEGESFEGKD